MSSPRTGNLILSKMEVILGSFLVIFGKTVAKRYEISKEIAFFASFLRVILAKQSQKGMKSLKRLRFLHHFCGHFWSFLAKQSQKGMKSLKRLRFLHQNRVIFESFLGHFEQTVVKRYEISKEITFFFAKIPWKTRGNKP